MCVCLHVAWNSNLSSAIKPHTSASSLSLLACLLACALLDATNRRREFREIPRVHASQLLMESPGYFTPLVLFAARARESAIIAAPIQTRFSLKFSEVRVNIVMTSELSEGPYIYSSEIKARWWAARWKRKEKRGESLRRNRKEK